MRALYLLLFGLLVAGSASAQQRPCDGATCGGHGACVSELQQAYCFCDEGFAARDLTCVPAPENAGPLRSSAAGARAVQIALVEVDRDLAHIGATRSEYPGALSEYVPPDGLWCSDFVSWVYRAAGVPFTGGYQGGWLLTNNATIRRWFERRGAWVQKHGPEWRTFQPRPGDYVRIRTRTWGHSAIVRHVEGDTLHLIEGNAGGRVRLTRYPAFRDHDRIDGFGLVTMPDARQR